MSTAPGGIDLPNEADTAAFGASLAAALLAARALAPPTQSGWLIALDGPLGAGKTTLVRAVLRALGWAGPVRSPTYTLVEHYDAGSLRVAHFDLYRIADPDELDAVGARELLSECDVAFIEWPQRGHGWLPAADLALRLEPVGNGRRLHASGATPVGMAIAARASDNAAETPQNPT